MTLHLSTDEQQTVRQGNPVRVRDSELGEDLVVCPAALFERMQAQLQEAAEDDEEQRAWLEMSMKSLSLRLREAEND